MDGADQILPITSPFQLAIGPWHVPSFSGRKDGRDRLVSILLPCVSQAVGHLVTGDGQEPPLTDSFPSPSYKRASVASSLFSGRPQRSAHDLPQIRRLQGFGLTS